MTGTAGDQPQLFCDGIYRHSDDIVTDTVTGESPINKPKDRPCDGCDGCDGEIKNTREVLEMAREYFSKSRREKNTRVTTVTSSQASKNACKTGHFICDGTEKNIVTDGQNTVTDTEKLPQFVVAARNRAAERGLVVKWADYETARGFLSIHDPTTGEWHDVPLKGAPAWAKSEAHKRRELYRAGNKRAYKLTSQEMEEIWEAERGADPFADEESGAVDERGVVYEDYLEGEEQ